MKLGRTVLSLLLFGLMSFGASASSRSTLYYTSSPSSWVGQGQTVLVSSDSFIFEATTLSEGTFLRFFIDDFAVNPVPGDFRWWGLDVASADGAPVVVGTYEDAERAAFRSPGHPGIDFDGNGRGNNTVSGRFEVLDIAFDSDMQLTTFAIDFTQYDETDPASYVNGSLRYHSTLPIAGVSAVPEPSTVGLFAVGLLLTGRRLRWRRHPMV